MFSWEKQDADRRRRVEQARTRAAEVRVEPLARYLRDPVGFIERYIPAFDMTGYSRDILNALVDPSGHGRSAAKGPRGLGKTGTSAVALIWFAAVHEAARADWKAVITSASWYQLGFFWADVHKWAREMDWDLLGIPQWREDTQLLMRSIHLDHGRATSASPDRAELIEGAHAAAIGDRIGAVLVVFDESKAIPTDTFDAIEGVFSGANQVDTFGYALAVSTPGVPSGRFYDIIRRAEGTEDWTVRSVSLMEAVRAGRITLSWARRLKRLWGASPFYAQQVEGRFSADQENAVIPSSWIEMAVDRWRDREAHGYSMLPELDFGIDVAREGKDRTVVCIGRGLDHVHEFRLLDRHDDFTKTATDIGQLAAHYGIRPSRIVIDADGMGAGLGDILRAQGFNVVFFRGAPRPEEWKDRSGELEAFNRRSAAWWHMRELLDPRFKPTLALPPVDELMGELAEPRLVYDQKGRIKVEAKEQTKKRLGRSPDVADACVYRHWAETVKPEPEVWFPTDEWTEQTNAEDWTRRPDGVATGAGGNLYLHDRSAPATPPREAR